MHKMQGNARIFAENKFPEMGLLLSKGLFYERPNNSIILMLSQVHSKAKHFYNLALELL